MVVADPRAEAELRQAPHVLGGERLPDAERQAATLVDPPEDPVRAEPAVLVVDRSDASLVRDSKAVAGRGDPLVLRDGDVPLAEAPRRLFAQDAGRLTGRVALDDAARHLEITIGPHQRRGVEPQRVVVLRPERGRALAGDLVERLPRRVLCPCGIAPAVPTDPLAPCAVRPDAAERLGEGRDAVELDVAAGERPRREVDVRVGERGQDAAAAKIDVVGRGEGVLVRPHASDDAIAGDRQGAGRRERPVHRPYDAVREDHVRERTHGLRDDSRVDDHRR